VLFFFLRRRRNKQQTASGGALPSYTASGPPPIGGQPYQYTGMAEAPGDEQHGHMVLPQKFNQAANVQQQPYPTKNHDAAAAGLLNAHQYGGNSATSPHQSPQMAYTDVSHPSHVSEIDTNTPSVAGSYVPYSPAHEMATTAPAAAAAVNHNPGAYEMYAPTGQDMGGNEKH